MQTLEIYTPRSAQPYASLSLPDEDESFGLLGIPLQNGRVAATVRDHGIDPEEFWADRPMHLWNEPITLGELRDWLGY